MVSQYYHGKEYDVQAMPSIDILASAVHRGGCIIYVVCSHPTYWIKVESGQKM